MAEKYGIGKRFITNEGYEVEIVEKIDYNKRKVRFENGHEVISKCSHICEGKIKNPYHPSVFKVGYLGVGDYKGYINDKTTPEHRIWRDVLQRCYDEKFQENKSTYKGIIVCEEWLNFQKFADFYHKNHPKIEGIKFHLDKDLLQENIKNKIYSPRTCIFLPYNVNLFLANKFSNNTSGYIGVCWRKDIKKWMASIGLFGEGKIKNLGSFPTPELASEAYQQARVIESEKVKEYLRSLNYLPENIIQLIK